MHTDTQSADNSTQYVTDTAPQTPCKYCKAPIETGAKICSSCKSYQSRFRNSLVYLAAVAGFFTLLLSGSTYILSNGRELYKLLTFSDKIRVVNFVYPGTAGDTDPKNGSFSL